VDISAHVGSAVRALREVADLSQEELAFRAKLDRTYISGIERNRRNPSVRSLQRVSDALGITLDAIFIKAREMAEGQIRRVTRSRSK
jgi:transcriptional regulator with XRE-family HTH domain